ncbi:hypothetical protein [Streptomyces chartreusis]
MPDARGNFSEDEQLERGRREAEAAAMFTEVQRADTKATTLCGVIGGLLAIDAAVLSVVPKSAWMSVTALAGAAVLLGVALVLAICAIRPVLPRGGRLRVFLCSGTESRRPPVDRQLRVQAERLELFTALAQRKFRIVRWSVDVTATALAVAGAGLLVLYITV